jgi:hypothetical protein
MKKIIMSTNENDTLNIMLNELAERISDVAEEYRVYLFADGETATEFLNGSIDVDDIISELAEKFENNDINDTVKKYAIKALDNYKANEFQRSRITIAYYAYAWAFNELWEQAVGEYVSEVFGG